MILILSIVTKNMENSGSLDENTTRGETLDIYNSIKNLEQEVNYLKTEKAQDFRKMIQSLIENQILSVLKKRDREAG